MQYQEFIDQVQHRARLTGSEAAEKATKATLETLAERLFGNEPEHISSQLPEGISRFLNGKKNKTKYSITEFLERISEREEVELPDSVFHAKIVLDVLKDAVSKGEIEHIRDQLPQEFYRLFEISSQS